MEDLYKSIKASLYDRTVSPLFGAVAISWALWNYRFFVVLFSSMQVQEKIQYIDEILYGDWPAQLGILIGYPLLTSLTFIFLYPYPARWVYEFWRNRQQELKQIRQRIEDETPLTLEESRRVRKLHIQQRVEHEREVQRLEEESKHYKQELIAAQEREEQLQKDLADIETKHRIARATPATDSEIESVLLSNKYRLFYNPQRGLDASKVMLFKSGGSIVEGNNNNEHSWRVTNGMLELLQADKAVHSRFIYIPESRIFVRTDETELPAMRGQYMVPDWK